MRSKLVVVLLACVSPLLSGCDPLNIEAAARVLGMQLDKSVQDFLVELRRVEMDLTKESQEWRNLIGQIRKDFKDFPAELSTEGRAMVDFILARAKENTDEIAKITGHLQKKDYGTAMRLFLAFQKATRSNLPPVAANFNPKSIDHVWPNHKEHKLREDRHTLILYGYNFQRMDDDKGKYIVEIRNKDGVLIRDESKHLSISTNYIAQLDIAPKSGVQFKPGDATLVVHYDRKVICTAPITWGERPPPPPAITKIILYIGTSKNDKDREITFHYTIHRISDGAQVGGISVGHGEVWPDDKKPRPSWRHLDIPITENARFPEADRLGYRLHVRYESSRGDPNWIGRLRAEAVLEGGRKIEILAETDDFEMGHHDRGRITDRVNRDFPFNR